MQQRADKVYRILLADDDPDDQLIAAEAIAEVVPNVSLTIVQNGKEALSHLAEAYPLPDVFITDLQMPQMNGFEALSEIRQSTDFRDLHVVVLSTSRAEEDIQKSLDLKATLYISKPSMFTEWVTEMRRVRKLLAWISILKSRVY